MTCYECGAPAVAICRWCGVALCRKHLAASLATRVRSGTMGCTHVMPKPDESGSGIAPLVKTG